MQIRIRQTDADFAAGTVMYEAEFRAYIKNKDGPTWGQTNEEILDSLDADMVFDGPQATGGTVYQFSMPNGVEQIDGKWYTKHILGPVFTDKPATEDAPAQTAAEQEAAYKAMKDAEQAASVRTQRNDKLKDCDWTMSADSTADKAAWATHRQALRDVTVQPGFPWTIDWPVAP